MMKTAPDLNAEPLVSVVVPVYNGDKYFETCLESIRNQTYQNWECVINNNCSTDNTLEVANRFASQDKRFKIFSNDVFLKMVSNWNVACSRISKDTKYLRVVGADDWLYPESIQKMVEVMEKHPSVGVCSSYRLNDRRVDMDGLDMWDGNVFNGKEILYRQLTRTLDISGSNSTVMYAIEHMKKIPRYPVVFDETTYHEDTELVYELMNVSDVGFVFQVLSYTRRHAKAYTTLEAFRYNTFLQLNEKVLWIYKGNDKKLNHLYRKTRNQYAFFLLSKKFAGDKETVNWHNKYIVRKFTPGEYLMGALTHNKLAKSLSARINKPKKS
jgi:glycosyltransferase involved in cell wall biosynthesis